MRLVKLEVEEGFLNGLSLDFDAGLNVLIGPRGAGKTSVIELIRFCLDLGAYTTSNQRAAREHALSVLRGGQCTLTVEIEGTLHKIVRSAEDDANDAPTFTDAEPIVLSQNEIEKVGLDAGGRLRLVDDFIGQGKDEKLEAGRLLTEVASITQELQSMTEQLARLDDEVLELAAVEEELTAAQVDHGLAAFVELGRRAPGTIRFVWTGQSDGRCDGATLCRAGSRRSSWAQPASQNGRVLQKGDAPQLSLAP